MEFLANKKAFIGVATILLTVPSLSFGVASVAYTKHMLNETQSGYATDTAAVVTALAQNKGASLNNELASSWVTQNTKLLDKTMQVKSVTAALTQDNKINVTTRYADIPFSLNARTNSQISSLLSSFSLNNQTSTSKAEIFYRPIEIVIGMDGSGMGPGISELLTSVPEALNKVFKGGDIDESVKVSLLTYADNVNIGRKYADKLIRKDSRALSLPNSEYAPEKNEETYEAQVASLESINPALVDDLLLQGGPGYDYDYAGVPRKTLKSASYEDIEAYLDDLDNPPESEADKWPLLVADGRELKESEKPETTVAYSNSDWSTFAPRSPYNFLSNYLTVNPELFEKTFYWGTYPIHISNTDKKTWGKAYLLDYVKEESEKYIKGAIWCAPSVPAMPILAGSSDLQEIQERLELFNNTTMTTCDEGLTWAYRLLSESWNNIWSDDGSYPAKFHGETEKHAYLILGAPLNGFTVLKYGMRDEPNILPQIFEKYAKAGIVLHVIHEPGLPFEDDLEDAKEKYGNTLGWEFIEASDYNLGQGLADSMTRNGRIRLYN